MNHKKVTFGQRWVRLAMLLSLFLIHDSVLKAVDVTLSWTANTEADLAGYKVHYGTSSRTYSSIVNVGNSTSYTVTGLGPGTYYFALTAYDTSNNESGYSNEAVKTLTGTPDTTPPVLSAVQATSVANTAATITWTTNEASDSQVDYGLTTGYGNTSVLNASLVTAHSQNLAGLTPNQLYHYRVKSKDSAGNLAMSTDFTFTTTNVTLTGPVAAYSFVEGTGSTVVDSSGYSNNGSLVNGPAWVSGKFGSALGFDGSSRYASIPNSAALNISGTGISIELWANITDSGSPDYALLSKPWNSGSMAAPYYQYAVEFDTNGAKTLDFYFADSAGVLRGPFSMQPTTTGVWTHIAFTYDGVTVKGYLNGVQQLATPQSASLQARGTNLLIGVDSAFGQPYRGTVDEIRIYNRALSQAEIQADMNTPIGASALSRCDCSGDGLTNAVDLQVLVNAILAGNNASSYDINRDGTVDVLDLQVLGNVILGVAACP